MNPQQAAPSARKRAAITAAVALFLQSPDVPEDRSPEPDAVITRTDTVAAIPRLNLATPLSPWKSMAWQGMRGSAPGYTTGARGAWRTR